MTTGLKRLGGGFVQYIEDIILARKTGLRIKGMGKEEHSKLAPSLTKLRRQEGLGTYEILPGFGKWFQVGD